MDILIFKASSSRKMVLTMFSIAFAAAFYGASTYVPAGALQMAFIVVPALAALSNIAALWRKSLVLGGKAIAYQGVWGKWSVPFLDIESWKVMKNPGGLNASLRLTTRAGKSYEVADLSALSVGDPDTLGSALAARIKWAKKAFALND